MKIPKSFQLFGVTIDVEFNEDSCNKDSVFGTANYIASKVTLTDKVNGQKMTDEKTEQTFYHEFVHHIIMELEYEKEFSIKKIDSEKFVEMFSKALHQALNSFRYD